MFLYSSALIIPNKRIDRERSEVKEMFEVNSTSECQTSDQKLSSSDRKVGRKSKPRHFENLTTVLQSWQPIDPSALRRFLITEIMVMLGERDFNCVRSCIPAIIVDKQYPVELLHYRSEQDIDEFVTRMLWMRQEFNSAIGILIGVPDEEIATKVQEAYEGLLTTDEDCVVLLI